MVRKFNYKPKSSYTFKWTIEIDTGDLCEEVEVEFTFSYSAGYVASHSDPACPDMVEDLEWTIVDKKLDPSFNKTLDEMMEGSDLSSEINDAALRAVENDAVDEESAYGDMLYDQMKDRQLEE